MNKLILAILGVTTLSLQSQVLTNKIVIDQFGYRPNSDKIAVLRNPETGFDASESYSPGGTFQVIKVSDGSSVFTGSPVIWNGGAEDPNSGDKAWWFDFSTVTNPGEYYVLDVANNVRSFEFEIKEDIYNDVLKHAMRVWFYQRSGHEKNSAYAGANWADGASHIGPLQDKNCRSYLTPNDSGSEKDVHGGWYDAGDLNKYTTWTANYIVSLLRAYSERPTVWTDDYNIPESGNGIPDILDEVKWGMDHLLRLQNTDGSTIAIVDAASASPPSAATDPSLYGGVNTSSTLASSAAYAYGSKIFGEYGDAAYAAQLKMAAEKAWDWAIANPAVEWKNNDAASGTSGLGAGQQEVDSDRRNRYKMRAAVYLFDITGEAEYKTFFESNYQNIHLISWNYAYPFESEEQDWMLYYANLSGITAAVGTDINSTYNTAMGKTDNFQAIDNETDPYRAHMKDYTWGSNKQNCSVGLMYWNMDYYNIDPSKSDAAMKASEDYIHYMHGVNPMNIVYLTNMYDYGAENCANQIYHTWFAHGSDWDDAKNSLYGPPPGIVPGGANPNYTEDACCPSGCGGATNNAKCTEVDVSEVKNQPQKKSYLDFNQSWPLNSWEITENSMGYQAEYIRLLSKFVKEPSAVATKKLDKEMSLKLFPNPTNSWVTITNPEGPIMVNELNGRLIKRSQYNNKVSLEELPAGIYLIQSGNKIGKVVKR